MRLTLIATAVASSLSNAQAEPTPGHACIAAGAPYQRVAATVARLGDCCTGRMQCSQFLSTTRVVRPAHDLRT